MGLDTYAQPNQDDELSERDVQAFMEARINLCGGILSGNGNDGSFRGKVYDGIVCKITGCSLYQYWIPVEDVAEMYRKLKSCRMEDCPGHEEDIENLKRFLKVCVDRELGLVGWW